MTIGTLRNWLYALSDRYSAMANEDQREFCALECIAFEVGSREHWKISKATRGRLRILTDRYIPTVKSVSSQWTDDDKEFAWILEDTNRRIQQTLTEQ